MFVPKTSANVPPHGHEYAQNRLNWKTLLVLTLLSTTRADTYNRCETLKSRAALLEDVRNDSYTKWITSLMDHERTKYEYIKVEGDAFVTGCISHAGTYTPSKTCEAAVAFHNESKTTLDKRMKDTAAIANEQAKAYDANTHLLAITLSELRRDCP